MIKVKNTSLEGFLIIEPNCFKDDRGFFLETYQEDIYKAAGITDKFVQDNQSRSIKGVIRGMHFQKPPYTETKLIRVIQGKVLDVFIDLRKNSATYGTWDSVELSQDNNLCVYIPKGFAHGFCALSDAAEFLYKVSENYSAEKEKGIIWNDPDIGIDWPISDPILSEKDKNNPSLRSL